MLTLFFKVLVIFLMIAVGFFCCRRHVLPDSAESTLVALVMQITCPCLVLHSMADCEMTKEALTDTVQVVVGSVIYYLVVMLFAILVVKFMRYEPQEDQGALSVVITSINTGFMGFPVTKAIFGSYMFFLMVMENVVLNLYLFLASPLQMRIGEDKAERTSLSPRSLISPTTIAVIVGVILLALRMDLPAPLMEFFSTVGDATIPISMIIVGIQLAQRDVRSVFQNHKLVAACIIHVLVVPVLTFLCVNWLPLTVPAKVLLIFAACFPTAVVPSAIAAERGKNAGLISSGIALTTAMSLITLPLAAYFLMAWYGI